MARHEFSKTALDELFAQCHRRCCVCHKFCGTKMEAAHIVDAHQDGADDIENAIPLCFDCHAEVSLYNPQHPKGKRFNEAELRHHRRQWLDLCRDRPEILITTQGYAEAGALERLLSEMDFNLHLAARHLPSEERLAPFEVAQFRRAIADGVFGWLTENVKLAIQQAYAEVLSANNTMSTMVGAADRNIHREGLRVAKKTIEAARPLLEAAIKRLHSERS